MPGTSSEVSHQNKGASQVTRRPLRLSPFVEMPQIFAYKRLDSRTSPGN